MTRVRSILWLCVVASSALAAPLPFTDGFEPPQTGFSSWTTTRVNGTNTLSQSAAQAWDETRALSFTYAGVTSSAQAAAVVDFSALTSPFVRFWLRLPAGTENAMASGTSLRLVRLGDAATGTSGTGGAAKVNLLLRKDPTGGLHLRLDYVNSSAGVTSFGTVLAARITEGTWHYVEFSYQPAASRVTLYIDDAASPRIDATAADLVSHNLQTAWVGLADAADAQASAVTVFLDAVSIAGARVGTAQAISQHFNELESGTLAVTTTPPGKAASTFTTGATGVSASAAGIAAHRGAFGLRVIDSDGQTGPGGGAGQLSRISPVGGTLHRRFFWRPSTTNGLGARTIAALSSTTLGSRAIAEVMVSGTGALSLGGFDLALNYVTTTSSSTASTNAWHLVELLLTGVGTNAGSRKLYLNGTLAAQASGLDWSGVTVDQLVDGQVFSTNRAFQGIDDFDDLRASRAVMPSRLVLSAPPMADRVCSGAVTIEARDSDGTARGVVEPMLLALSVSGLTGSFFSDASCTSAISSIPLAVGTSQATVFFRPATAGSATLTATNLDALSVPAVVAVSSRAVGLGFITAGQSISAGACSGITRVQAQDASGGAATVASSTVVALSASSGTLGFFSDSSCVTAVTSVTILEAQSVVGFFFKETVAGAPTLTATAAVLGTANQQQTVSAAVPSRLVVQTPARTAIAGACSGSISFQAQDTYGNPVAVEGATQVSFSSTSAGATVFADTGCGTPTSLASIVAGSTTVTVYFRDTIAGSPQLTAAAPGYLNGTQTQTVLAAAPARVAFSSPSQLVTAGACSAPALIEVQDAFGNAAPVSAALALSLTGGASVAMFSDAACATASTSVTVSSGSSSQVFHFIGNVTGPITLGVSATGLTSATQDQLISASGPTRLVVISAPQTVTAGGCSAALLIQAQDSFGNPAAVSSNTSVVLTTTSTTQSFSPTGACASSVGNVTLATGTDTVAAYFRDTVTGPIVLTVMATGLTLASQPQTIRAAAPSALAIATTAPRGVAGACLGPITGQSRDGFGNAAVVLSATALALRTTSTRGIYYSNATCTAAITQSTIAAGSSATTFYYRDLRAASPTLTASNPGLSAPTQVAVISPAPPTALTFVTAPQTLTAGNCSAVATVEVRDAFNNPSPLTMATEVVLSSSSSSTRLHSSASCDAVLSSAGIVPGGTRASFFFKDLVEGAPTLTARVAGLSDATQLATINRGPAAKLAFLTPPQSPVAGTCSSVLTVQVQDVSGNAVQVSSVTSVALSTSTPTGALYFDSACTRVASQVNIGAGGNSAAFYFKDTSAGPWGVTATGPGLSPGAQTVTVLAGAPARLRVRSAPQTLTAGACSAAVTLDFEDVTGNPASVAVPVSLGLSSTAPSTSFYEDSSCATAVSSLALDAGVAVVGFYFRDTRVGAPALTMTLPGAGPAVQAATIIAGAVSQLAFTTPPQRVSVTTCSSRATLEQQDAAGNPLPTPSDLTVTLSSSASTAGFFSDADCSTPITSLTLAAGTSSAGFYFQGAMPGMITLTGSALPLADATQQANLVVPGAPAVLRFVSAPQTLEAAACSGAVTVELRDANGDAATVSQPALLRLSASSPGVTFHADGSCGAAMTSVTVPVGNYRALFHFRDPVVHAPVLTVSTPGVTAADQAQQIVCPVLVDGAACDDDDLCNGREQCVAGRCALGTTLSCDDADACTTDGCAGATGCSNQVVAGCCRAPSIAQPSLRAAVGVPYRVGLGALARVVKGTGPLRWGVCDTAPAGFSIDATTGLVQWVPTSAGPQPLCLTVAGACGQDSARFTVLVDAVLPAAPVAAFTFSPSAPLLGSKVTVDGAASTGTGPLSHEWSWGPGIPRTFGSRSTHLFPTTGARTVSLEVFDAVGQRAVATQSIVVSGPACPTPPVARIRADVLQGEGPLKVVFECECSQVPAGAVLRWSFGDGSTAYGSTTAHTFEPGAYQVRLQVSAGDCAAEDTVEIRVTDAGRQPPSCSASVDPTGGPAPLAVSFRAIFGSRTGVVKTAAWRFSDGLSADAMAHEGTASRTLTSPGTLGVELLVTDEVGLTCRSSVEVTATTQLGGTLPQIVSVPNATARCGEPWQYDDDGVPSALGSVPLAWSLGKGAGSAGIPSGLSIEPTTGALSWTPALKTRGPTRIVLVVENESGAAEQDFLVEVECAPQACGCSSPGPVLGLAVLALLARFRRRRADPGQGQP